MLGTDAQLQLLDFKPLNTAYNQYVRTVGVGDLTTICAHTGSFIQFYLDLLKPQWWLCAYWCTGDPFTVVPLTS